MLNLEHFLFLVLVKEMSHASAIQLLYNNLPILKPTAAVSMENINCKFLTSRLFWALGMSNTEETNHQWRLIPRWHWHDSQLGWLW